MTQIKAGRDINTTQKGNIHTENNVENKLGESLLSKISKWVLSNFVALLVAIVGGLIVVYIAFLKGWH